MISIIHCIFCKDHNTFIRAKNSLLSLQRYQSYPIYICGYIEYEYWNALSTLLPSSVFTRLDENKGKSYIINTTLPKISTPYFLALDSDIVLQDLNLEKIVEVYERMEHIGFLALNQRDDCRHNTSLLEEVTIDGVRLGKSYDGYGIAGGALFSRKELILSYPFPDVGCYGPEETILLYQLCHKGHPSFVLYDMYVVHPKDDDPCFYQWKKDRCLTYLKTNSTNPSPPFPV